MLGPAGIGAKDTQAADQNSQFWRGQGQQLRAVDEELLGLETLLAAVVVAEPVSGWLSGSKYSTSVSSCDASMRPGVNGTFTSVPGLLRRLLDRRAAAENDQVGKRDLLAAGTRS